MKTPNSGNSAPRSEAEILKELADLEARRLPLSQVRPDLLRLDRELKAARAALMSPGATS